MAITTSVVPSFQFRINFFSGQVRPLYRYALNSGFHSHQTSFRYSIKVLAMTPFSEPREFINHVNNFKDKLWESSPEAVKEFPWKKAEDIFLQHFLFHGKKAAKLSLLVLFIFSSFSDVMLSISRNKELIIPIGLLVGCVMGDFFKAVAQELFRTSKEGDSRLHLLAIGFFFVLVKVASTCFSLGQCFLPHIGNGGLMQVLWLWKKWKEETETSEQSEPSMIQDTPINSVVEN